MAGKIVSRVLLAGAMAATLLVSGCGRKAPLEVPAAPAVDQVQDADGAAQATPEPAKSNDFILDPLIR